MLNWLLNKVRPSKPHEPVAYSRDEHIISRKHISRNALKVMSRLHGANYAAYLVGGGVRDLLLGKRPKDFDIATDATPEEVRKLFRNSRIIGRRFRIVHVRFGPEIIEVTTFRGHHSDGDQSTSKQSDSGLLLRDNVFGDIEDDAIRRDFTINALYYTTEDFSVFDFTGGVNDLDNRIVRMIGDPETRYREDPVRMLRAVRFAAKLGFEIEKSTAAAIYDCRHLLADIAPARLFDEVNKLFMSGQALATLNLLHQYRLFEILFPNTSQYLEDPIYREFLEQTMLNTDKRIRAERPVTPAFLYAALLWPDFNERVKLAKGMPIFDAIREAANAVFSQQIRITAVPKRFSAQIREIWELQWRLPNRGGSRAQKLVEQSRFRAAYDFLLIREAAGEDCDGLGYWWTKYQQMDADERASLASKVPAAKRPRRRKRPGKPKPKS
ncbi:polynucleotide adenylyltransferase PcnB [Umboniibacter marinipuniceus]|uniref:Poly(A) polymerase I n=1 Tax=Umboniibacter marinipuniceus TaxID=569599 RepID=A0A3M0A704_9GAMM|nr:polynucleotide adenylyltransferase PcnB [Umboniibacter marinipuniceus]RMA80084.1 poly(A) polymerase [Umboniibacter marinipuniceus]